MGNKVTNCEVRPQALWFIAKSLTKRDEPRAPPVIHGSLGPTSYPINNAKKSQIAQETSSERMHDLCDCDRR
jgi:hypothetical protein